MMGLGSGQRAAHAHSRIIHRWLYVRERGHSQSRGRMPAFRALHATRPPRSDALLRLAPHPLPAGGSPPRPCAQAPRARRSTARTHGIWALLYSRNCTSNFSGVTYHASPRRNSTHLITSLSLILPLSLNSSDKVIGGSVLLALHKLSNDGWSQQSCGAPRWPAGEPGRSCRCPARRTTADGQPLGPLQP